LLTVRVAEEKAPLTVTDKLQQQFRHTSGKVNLSLSIGRLQVIMYFAAPRLLVNDDPGTAVENLFDSDTQGLTKSQTG
jgi:hypothetical protein